MTHFDNYKGETLNNDITNKAIILVFKIQLEIMVKFSLLLTI